MCGHETIIIKNHINYSTNLTAMKIKVININIVITPPVIPTSDDDDDDDDEAEDGTGFTNR